MPVKKDEHGNRSVEASVEVPGSPEDVWRAIATGPGISSWFMPSKVDGREGGEIVCSYGPGMDSVAKITTWNPPLYFAAESEQEGLGKIATQWFVEASDGGMCMVRVVHRWFASTDDWDAQFDGAAYGWATSFFRTLRLYVENFTGQKCSAFQLTAFSQASGPETWRTIRSALRINRDDGRVTSAPDAPDLAGVIENLDVSDPDLLRARETVPLIVAAFEGMNGENPELLIRLERPVPGFAHIFTVPMGGPTMVSARFHLFGDAAAGMVRDYESAWQEWMNQHFPAESAGEGA